MLPTSKRGNCRARRIDGPQRLRRWLQCNKVVSTRKPHFEQFEQRLLLAADFADHGEFDASGHESQGKTHPAEFAHTHEVFARHAFDLHLPQTNHLVNHFGYLTDPSAATPLAIAHQFLADQMTELGLDNNDLRDYIVTDQYTSEHNGVTHVYLQQRHLGLPVANARANLNINQEGRILNAGSSFVPLRSTLNDERSIEADLDDHLSTNDFDAYDPAYDDPSHWESSAPFGQVAPELNAVEALEHMSAQFGWEILESPTVMIEELAPANRGQRQVLSAEEISSFEIPAELQFVPQPYGVELAWRLTVRRPDNWFDAHISASSGKVLSLGDWAAHASYNVFALPKESPNDGPRTLEVDPHDTTASPFGWHDTNGAAGAEFTITRGNNAYAYTDHDANNVPDLGSSPDGGASLVFDFPVDLAQPPTTYTPASVVQAFYMTNSLHDIFYQYGFTEASGNFQVNNYGKGGAESDPVLVEVQESLNAGARNNASFFTPPDGTAGQLQMLLYNLTTPERDGAMSYSLVSHEYAHGVTNRLTGGPSVAGVLSAVQSAAMGEGWSDWYSLVLSQSATDTANEARGYGTYLAGQATTGSGPRNAPYSYNMTVNDYTYGDLATMPPFFPHDIGEVWGSILWDLNWALIQGSALDANLPTAGLGFDSDYATGTGGNNLALQMVTDALTLQPPQPTFLQARDAILAAERELTGGTYQQTLWTVFARRGMGYSASDLNDPNSLDVVEAFDLPATPNGTIVFEQIDPLEGELLSILLRDLDLTSSQTLQISSSSGDVEMMTLDPTGPPGVFRGFLDTGAGANAADGVLQVNSGDIISVTYVDANNGIGGTNISKMATVTMTTRFASPLLPQTPSGSLLSTSHNLALLRSDPDIEPFTFFAEAGEQIGVTAAPFGDVILDVQVVGVTAVHSSAAAGDRVVVPTATIPADGLYQVFVGANGAVTADVTISRNAVVEQSIGDAADGNELAIDGSAIPIGGGTRYAVSAQSVPVGPGIINGSFETGDFSGWDVIAIGNPLVPWMVTGAGSGTDVVTGFNFGLQPTHPQDGNFVAWNSFEGAGPMNFELKQDVLLPPQPVSLSWKDRIQWDFTIVEGVATESRTFELQIRDPVDETVLGTVYTFDTTREFENPTGDTGWQTRTVDLSAFAGQLVELAFISHIPQIWTGPGQFEIDDVALVGMPAPAPDIDEFQVDLNGKAGKQIDIIFGSEFARLSSSVVELLGTDGTTVLATASTTPIDPALELRNYRSGILGFTVPADGIYTVRVTAPELGEYHLLVNESVVFDTEANDDLPVNQLRSLDNVGGAMGYVDGVNLYEIVDANFDFLELPLAESFYVFIGDDVVSTARNIEFDFEFFGQTHNQLYVSSNGFLTFLPNQYHGCCFGRTFPHTDSPNAVIAGWWRDLHPGAPLGDPPHFIRHNTFGTPGDRIFYLDFIRIPHFSDFTSTVTMQFKLFEATDDIEVHYEKAPADGFPHSAGIENHTGTVGFEAYWGLDSLPDNVAVRYQRTSPLDRYTLTLSAGQEVTIQTDTPFDAAGHAVPNTLDPELRLIHPDGSTVVASDQNSAPDGKNAALTFTAQTAGIYTVELAATSGIGAYALNWFEPDRVGPRITDVILGSSAWTGPFIDVVDGGGANAGNGLGISITGPTQLLNRSWTNLDKIYLQFDEDVSADFAPANLQLTGVNVADYMPTVGVAYGVDGSNIGTLTLSSPIANDILSLRVGDTLKDGSGNALDGEWTDGESLISGNGTSGGNFVFRIDSLPGDVDDSGGVNLVDVFAVLGQSGKVPDAAIQGMDVDGSGGINLVDVFAVLGRSGTALPNPPGGFFMPFGGNSRGIPSIGEGESVGTEQSSVDGPPAPAVDTVLPDFDYTYRLDETARRSSAHGSSSLRREAPLLEEDENEIFYDLLSDHLDPSADFTPDH